jgi:hypothetical protein
MDMTIKPIAPRIPIMVAKSTFPPKVLYFFFASVVIKCISARY